VRGSLYWEFLNMVRTMAIRDSYERGFDEDIQTESSANQCPEYGGHVTTNIKETVCEDCGFVIEEYHTFAGARTNAQNAPMGQPSRTAFLHRSSRPPASI
jgi:hypothetical protein